ncbi:unnamed protein product [Rotaria magnacalcarata]
MILSDTIEFIQQCTLRYGKVKLVLKHSRYFIESIFPEVLKELLRDQQCRVVTSEQPHVNIHREITSKEMASSNEQVMEDIRRLHEKVAIDDDELDELKIVSFEVVPNKIELLRRQYQQSDCPLLDEYDFRCDSNLRNLNIELRPNAFLRSHQERSLRNMFGGVAAACTINKPCLALCNSKISVERWKQQFTTWFTTNDSNVKLFISGKREKLSDAYVYISAYSMIAQIDQSNNHAVADSVTLLKNCEWSLMILDEVHTILTEQFRKVLTIVYAYTKLDLTATLVREDNKIADLNFLIGPKLHEANWMESQSLGHVAKALCGERQYKTIQLAIFIFHSSINSRKIEAENDTHLPITGVSIKHNFHNNNTETLKLTIKTGNEWLAGTDDAINLLLRSANGLICRVYNLDNWGNDRERNSIDKYTVCCPEGFLNDKRELSMFALAHVPPSGKNGRASTNDWFIEHVELRASERIVFNYRFHAWTSPSEKWMFGVSKVNDNNNPSSHQQSLTLGFMLPLWMLHGKLNQRANNACSVFTATLHVSVPNVQHSDDMFFTQSNDQKLT